MTYYIITAEEHSLGPGVAPAADDIERAFSAINEAWSRAASAQNRQPSRIYQPIRIVRLAGSPYVTKVAALASVDLRGRPETEVKASIVQSVTNALREKTRSDSLLGRSAAWFGASESTERRLSYDADWSGVFVNPYSAERNGPVDFWTTGRASNTVTRVQAEYTGVGAVDNPVGPNELARTQRSLAGAAAEYAVASTGEAAAQSNANRQDLELPAAERRRREQEEKAYNQKMLMIGGGVIVVSLLAVAAIKYSGVAERLSKKLNPGRLPKTVEDYGKCVERWHRTGRESDRDAAMRCKRDMSPAHKQLAVSIFGGV